MTLFQRNRPQDTQQVFKILRNQSLSLGKHLLHYLELQNNDVLEKIICLIQSIFIYWYKPMIYQNKCEGFFVLKLADEVYFHFPMLHYQICLSSYPSSPPFLICILLHSTDYSQSFVNKTLTKLQITSCIGTRNNIILLS